MKKEINTYEDAYTLLDSGNGRKLEKFGAYVLSRPCAQAVWRPSLMDSEWRSVDAVFTRENENQWIKKAALPDAWTIEVEGIHFKIAPTDFGHLGIFPEQRDFWRWIQEAIGKEKRELNVLNLFAYSGGSTLAAAKAGAKVCHLDASKGMVAWARENAQLNGLEGAPVRWIIDDAGKFLQREVRRGVRYDAIILDPPTFGRGSKGEVFKIEEDIIPILQNCRELLSDDPLFVLFTCHTPGFSPLVLRHLLSQMMEGKAGTMDEGEMVLAGECKVLPVPSGTFARWVRAV